MISSEDLKKSSHFVRISKNGGGERTKIILPEFDRKWANIGFGDKELAELEYQLCLNPQVDVIMWGHEVFVSFVLRSRTEKKVEAHGLYM